MKTLSLNGSWQVKQLDADLTLPATVPGVVHLDLLNAGKIPPIDWRDNEEKTLWVSQKDWQYSRDFQVDADFLADADQVILRCEGLDTAFIRDIARKEGVHIYIDTDENLHASNDIVSIHARSKGVKTIRLPRRCDVVEIYSGRTVARDTDVIEIPMEAFDTQVFLLGEQLIKNRKIIQ